MMRNVTKKLNYITRWLLLIGVLGGLFFSGGEGIQLLPFPEKSEQNSIPFQAEINKSYSISTHNAAFVHHKTQKHIKHSAHHNFLSHNFQPTTYRVFTVGQTLFKPSSFYILRTPIAQSDRAPPLTV